jgi:hypothetical protein
MRKGSCAPASRQRVEAPAVQPYAPGASGSCSCNGTLGNIAARVDPDRPGTRCTFHGEHSRCRPGLVCREYLGASEAQELEPRLGDAVLTPLGYGGVRHLAEPGHIAGPA